MAKAATIKTKPTRVNVSDFIAAIQDDQKRYESKIICEMMQKATHEKPIMWGSSIIGFGEKKYKSPATGREVDWFIMGFSPRKAAFSLYLLTGLEYHSEALKKLGKYKTGAGCLYIKSLSDIHLDVLENMIIASARKI